jgi:hypothetical protein
LAGNKAGFQYGAEVLNQVESSDCQVISRFINISTLKSGNRKHLKALSPEAGFSCCFERPECPRQEIQRFAGNSRTYLLIKWWPGCRLASHPWLLRASPGFASSLRLIGGGNAAQMGAKELTGLFEALVRNAFLGVSILRFYKKAQVFSASLWFKGSESLLASPGLCGILSAHRILGRCSNGCYRGDATELIEVFGIRLPLRFCPPPLLPALHRHRQASVLQGPTWAGSPFQLAG